MVPVSVRSDSEMGTLGNRISALFVDLPVGEPNPVLRLAQVSYAMRGHKESGQSVGADALVALSGFAPPTLHALGARAANSLTRRLFNLVVTNVPGPQHPAVRGRRAAPGDLSDRAARRRAGGIDRRDVVRRRRVLRPECRPRRHARRRRAGFPDRGVACRTGRRQRCSGRPPGERVQLGAVDGRRPTSRRRVDRWPAIGPLAADAIRPRHGCAGVGHRIA